MKVFERNTEPNPLMIASEAFAYKILLFSLLIAILYQGIKGRELNLGITEVLWTCIFSGFAAIGYRVYRKDLGISVLIFSSTILIVSLAVFLICT